MSLNQLRSRSERIAVVGAGVVGLSTALCIQNKLPDARITLIADKFNEQTLSDGAGGLFRPELDIGPSIDILKQWCKDSYEHFLSILKSEDAGEAGVQFVSGFYLSSLDEIHENPLLNEFLPDTRKMCIKELSMFPESFKNGLFFTTIIADCRRYLPWMMKQFQEKGGMVENKTVESFDQLAGNYDTVVNCTGLRAKDLTKDYKLVPIRGQTIKVKAPWIKHFFYGDEVYIIPGIDYVTLGGIKEYGSWNMNINPYHCNLIWEKCLKLVPSLKKATIEWNWVGLRPFRQPVRVEKEIIQYKDKVLKIVHNYGHGGHGVTLSWGTAKHATELVVDLTKEGSCQ
ncbi:D-aspartate oxidase-like [Centruroides sculpturatus]|uniref:D-aspartate oxidase-like n=1 Tax=Centruroides sculpturatus TaxID=218467 RepID=UPI000C6EDDA2|nr:D-aspartate oxidase-like [Centruroides sculpturatus]